MKFHGKISRLVSCTRPTGINDRSNEQHQLLQSIMKKRVGPEPADLACKICKDKLNLRGAPVWSKMLGRKHVASGPHGERNTLATTSIPSDSPECHEVPCQRSCATLF